MKYISGYIRETPFNGNDRIIYECIQASQYVSAFKLDDNYLKDVEGALVYSKSIKK